MPLEAHLEHFWGLLAEWLWGGLWMLILNISRASGHMSLSRAQEAQVAQLLDEFHAGVVPKVEFFHYVKFGHSA